MARRSSAQRPRIRFSMAYSAAIRSSASWAMGAGPPVRPAEGQCHRAAVALRIGQLLVDRVSVAMNDAGIARQQGRRVLGTAAGSIGVDNGRRIQPAPGPIIPRDRPEVAGLGA